MAFFPFLPARHAGSDAPAEKKASWWRRLRVSVLPVKGDSAFETVRKILFCLAVVTMVVSLTMLLWETVLIPASYTAEVSSLRNIAKPQGSDTPTLSGLAALREQNSDTVGWLTFVNEDVGLSVDYPVMQAEDNNYYLTHTFFRKKNRTGCLFLDYRNKLTADQRDPVTLIYGHNLSTGLMFSSLNKLVDNLYNARKATSFSLSSDAGTETYVIFSILLANADESKGPVFSYIRQDFRSAEDFNMYKEELLHRSMYRYPVEVNEDDMFLLLSTCTPTRKAHYKGSRTVVAARRLRDGESLPTGTITTNPDCLYPLAYYTEKGLTVPREYTGLEETYASATSTAVSGSATGTPSGTTALTVPSDTTGSSGLTTTTTTRTTTHTGSSASVPASSGTTGSASSGTAATTPSSSVTTASSVSTSETAASTSASETEPTPAPAPDPSEPTPDPVPEAGE